MEQSRVEWDSQERKECQAPTFSESFFQETIEILKSISTETIEGMASDLSALRARRGRLFILGVGGSSGHAGHAVNDFRKICQIEAYSPTDNVSELTARTNDEGWDTTFSEWLKISKLRAEDGLLILSVGGGDAERNISPNIVKAIDLAVEVGASIFGIVGKKGGYTKMKASRCVVIPPLFENRITPHTEGLCAVVWHLLVSHPLMQVKQTKWESQSKLSQ